MASHIPTPTTEEHFKMLSLFPEIKTMPILKRMVVEGGYIFRLSSDYQMNEYHGLVDDEIVSFTPDSMHCTFEIHLDSSGKINQVYLVM